MEKKKRICISFAHLERGNGVARAAISTANLLAQKYDVTLVPLFAFERQVLSTINKEVHVRRVFGFYFHGLAKIVDIVPDCILYWLIYGCYHYDLEIAYQMDLPIKIIGGKHCGNNKKKLAWMHGYDYGLTLKEQYERIGKVICVSKSNAERLENELSTIKIDYCYNPIDDKAIVEQGEKVIDLKRPSDHPLFISVGRLSQEKGYYRLLDVFAHLKEDGFVFSFWLVGDGPEHDNLVKHCNELDLNNVVTFIGATSNPHKYTSKADIFICSSFSEGYSTACTEAIMLGIPVISTDVSGSKEIISDSECGIRCGLDNENLYQAIKTVLSDQTLILKWKTVLKKTKHRFSQEERINRLFNTINSCL